MPEREKYQGHGPWKEETIEEFAVPGTTQVWKAQRRESPADHKVFVGLRKFARKADGTLQVTSVGLGVELSPISARLLRKLGNMLVGLADHIEANPDNFKVERE